MTRIDDVVVATNQLVAPVAADATEGFIDVADPTPPVGNRHDRMLV